MSNYPHSAYHNPWPAGTSPNGAQSRGWGPGWPNCQPSKMKTVAGGGVRVTCRAEIAPMVADLLSATDKVYNILANSTGAYNCRPIAGTSTPSNHSWGLAIDINWNDNPRSSNFTCNIPPAIVAMWSDCGFFWGGFYAHSTPDPMHFEYIGTPASVAANAAKAKVYNTGAAPAPSPSPTPAPAPAPGLVVAAATITQASKVDPKSTSGKPPAGTKDMVLVVEKALSAEGLLDKSYVDGLFGSKTVEAYKAWQTKLGYKGTDADGIPGFTSLAALGKKYNFTVVH